LISGWTAGKKNGKTYDMNKQVAFGFIFSNQKYREYETFNHFKNQECLSKTYLDEKQNHKRKELKEKTENILQRNFEKAIRHSVERIIGNKKYLELPPEIIDIIWVFITPFYYIGIMTDGRYGVKRNSTSCTTTWVEYHTWLIIDREHKHKITRRGTSEYNTKNLEFFSQETLLQRKKFKFIYQDRIVHGILHA
jgi:hypothetical protein